MTISNGAPQWSARVLVVAAAFACSDVSRAQGTTGQAELLGDLFGQVRDSDPDEFTRLGLRSFFVADGDGVGREVFSTDGTTAGTRLLVDLVPGPDGSDPQDLTSAGGKLYFRATDTGTATRALFVSNGTAGDATLLQTGSPQRFQARGVNGRLVALQSTGLFGPQDLLLSDGTVPGTSVVSLGTGGPSVIPLPNARQIVRSSAGTDAFVAVPTANGLAVFVSDGTVAGTQQLTTISLPNTTTLRGFGELSPGILAFALQGLPSGGPGAVVIVDAVTGSSTTVGALTTSGESPPVFFDGRGFLGGDQVTVFDQATVGTEAIPANTVNVRLVGVHSGSLWAIARTSGGGVEFVLRRDAGTAVFLPAGPLPTLGTTAIDEVARVGSRLLFTARAGSTKKLCAIDTMTGSGLEIGRSTAGFAFESLGELPGRALFTGIDALGTEPWMTDGTVAGTGRLADVLDVVVTAEGSDPRNFAPFGRDTVLTTARTNEIWSSDGTSLGTTLFANEAIDSTIGDFDFVPAGDNLFVTAEFTPNGGSGVLVVDPSSNLSLLAADVVTVLPDPEPFGLRVFARSQGTYSVELIDAAGTRTELNLMNKLLDVEARVFGEYSLVSGIAFGSPNVSLFLTDGAMFNTTILVDARSSTFIRSLAEFDGHYWFVDDTGYQISDGLSVSASPATFDGDILVPAEDLLFGRNANGQLAVFDGATTTVLPASQVEALTPFADRLLLRAGVAGELFVSDGTAAGTLSLGVEVPAPLDDDLIYPVSRELAYFVAAPTGAASRQLWRTDGTVAGTTFVQDLEVVDGRFVNGALYLSVDDPALGREPYVLRPEVVHEVVGFSCSGHRTGTTNLHTDVDPRIGRNVQVQGRSRNAGQGTGQGAAILLGFPGERSTLFAPSKCYLHLDTTRPIGVRFVPVNGAGDFALDVAIPPFAVLAGTEVMFQAFVAPSPGPLGVDFTPALRWVIGG